LPLNVASGRVVKFRRIISHVGVAIRIALLHSVLSSIGGDICLSLPADRRRTRCLGNGCQPLQHTDI
jgi:hypothetical protein